MTTAEDLRPTADGRSPREIAANAPLAVQSIKRTIDGFAFRGLTEAMRFEAMSASIEFVSDDMPAGLRGQGGQAARRLRGQVAPVPLPEPPPAGHDHAARRAPSTGSTVVVTGGGHRARQGHRRRVRPAGRGRRRSCRAARSTGRPGSPRSRRSGGRAADAAADIRQPEEVAAAFDAVEEALGPGAPPREQRRRQLPGAGRGPERQRLAGGDPDRPRRHVLLLPGAVPPGAARAGEPAAICNILATQAFTGGPGHGAQRGGQGGGGAT